jgi:hypothetical protein
VLYGLRILRPVNKHDGCKAFQRVGETAWNLGGKFKRMAHTRSQWLGNGFVWLSPDTPCSMHSTRAKSQTRLRRKKSKQPHVLFISLWIPTQSNDPVNPHHLTPPQPPYDQPFSNPLGAIDRLLPERFLPCNRFIAIVSPQLHHSRAIMRVPNNLTPLGGFLFFPAIPHRFHFHRYFRLISPSTLWKFHSRNVLQPTTKTHLPANSSTHKKNTTQTALLFRRCTSHQPSTPLFDISTT